MPGTTSTALPSFSDDEHHETDAAKRKGRGWRRYAHFTVVYAYIGKFYKETLNTANCVYSLIFLVSE